MRTYRPDGGSTKEVARALNPRAHALFVPLLGLAAVLLFARPVLAGNGGAAGMQILKYDISPRALGMGGAYTAVADDIYSVNYNPAGLGQLHFPEISSMYLSGFEDTLVYNTAIGMPLPIKGLGKGLSKPVAGLSLLTSDAGSFTQRTINDDGTITSGAYDAQNDLALTFSYGEQVASGEVNFFEWYKPTLNQYFGLNVKYLRSTMLEEYSASGFAMDAGWLVMDPQHGLSFGLSYANFLASKFTYVSENTKLPAILRLGLSYQHATIMDQAIILAADWDFYTNEGSNSLRLGTEYSFRSERSASMFGLRFGYRSEEDNPGITFGLGVRYNDVSLDVGMGSGEVYNTSQVSFSYKFSGIKVKQYDSRPKYRNMEQDRSGPSSPAPKKASPRKPESPASGTPEKKKDSDFFLIF